MGKKRPDCYKLIFHCLFPWSIYACWCSMFFDLSFSGPEAAFTQAENGGYSKLDCGEDRVQWGGAGWGWGEVMHAVADVEVPVGKGQR